MTKKKTAKKVVDKTQKLNPIKFGLSLSIICGVFMLVLGIAYYFEYFALWTALMYDAYGKFGYSPVTILGNILGIIYGMIDGFITGWVFAFIYNKLS